MIKEKKLGVYLVIFVLFIYISVHIACYHYHQILPFTKERKNYKAKGEKGEK